MAQKSNLGFHMTFKTDFLKQILVASLRFCLGEMKRKILHEYFLPF